MKKFVLLPVFFLSVMAYGQQVITGRVTDRQGEALVGATIVEKNTNNGTTTNATGQYQITTRSASPVLVFSYVGFQRTEIPVNGQTPLNATLEEANTLTQVNVVGSRNLNRSVTDSPSPIDLIDIREVTSKTGQLDLNQLLQFAAPSFNSNRQTGSDGADHVDPATLRGLGPDQTLVLINGKRRHQSSLVNLFGTRGRGNTGTDLNAISAAAIERIEILRDGASAQYGSDAIAGVINIVLKSNVNEFTGNVNYGMYQAKYRFDDKKFDGANVNVNANYGWRIGREGFVNLTADYNFRDHTQRANVPTDIARRQYGDPKIQNTSFYVNSAIPVSANAQIYAFGGLNLRRGDAYAWTRFADSDRNIPSIYPNGFDPIISSNIVDGSFAAGIRGLWKGWNVDLGNVFGSNRFHYTVNNTLNTSLGANSPTSFDAGGFQLQQNVTGLHFTRNFKNTLQGLNIAFGSEFRAERYLIFAGEEASYRNYDPTKPGGSQGFPGYQPGDVINKGRTNLGVYVDTEADITNAFMLGAAVRFENYSDFGSTLNGKLSTRLRLSDKFTLRATASTGFRAPSLAQIYFNSTFTNFVNGQPVEVLLARNNSAVTQKLGIPSLKQETSRNLSVGFTGRLASNFTVTVDGYLVNVKDRVVLTGAFTNDDPDIGADLQALRVGQAQFFTNAVSTTTRGLDVILAHSAALGRGRLNTTLAANFNRLTVDEVKTNDRLRGKEDTYFDLRERKFVEASAPPSKINLTLDYGLDRWTIVARAIRFGQVELANYNVYEGDPTLNFLDVYTPRITTDLSVGYRLTNQVRLTLGGTNIFNVYPNLHDPTLTESGGAWDPVQMGSNGAFWYAKLNLRF
ncbi:TonB-dependent receptor [Spirosoma taeanense]|uniref:TonB-dependent receptor n=1 Tax=Spirosoma taeanense TaxID=2735870 RepID=A0A6M5Y3Z3_9BACT|nr:TonB-dependent receptor [Spirosoma taeanense]QJW88096.1 TonB-dependent receptor [Spirosoma taeanense]